MNDYRQHPANTRHWAGKAALTRIADAPLSDQQRFLLSECVTAYLPVTPEQGAQLGHFLEIESSGRVKAMNVTTYDKGMAAGRRQGAQFGGQRGTGTFSMWAKGTWAKGDRHIFDVCGQRGTGTNGTKLSGFRLIQ